MDLKGYKIILGSSSPRRIEMFKNHGLDPVIIKPQCEENLPYGISGEDAVMLLSLRKALEVENLLKSGRYESAEISKSLLEAAPFIIASDTIVYHNGIIGKPQNRCHAESILNELSGRVHYVMSGVTILQAGKPVRRTFCEITEVHFKDYTDEELQSYLDTEEPYDKAGAYAIQGYFAKYIDHIEGDYDNIVGFPWARFEKELNKLITQL